MITLHMQHTTDQALTLTEDPMETTSDADQSFEAGEEIDIDLDLSGEKQEDGEVADIVENNDALTGQELDRGQDIPVDNDDEMEDDGYAGIAEQISAHDEDLEDAEYISPDIHIDTAAPTVAEDPSEQQSELFDDEDQLEEIEPEDHDYDKQQDADTDGQMDVNLYQQPDHYNHISRAASVNLNDTAKDPGSGNLGKSQLLEQSSQNQSREDSPAAEETNLDESSAVPQGALHQSYKVNSNSPKEPMDARSNEPADMPHEDLYQDHEVLLTKTNHHESDSIAHTIDRVSDDLPDSTKLGPSQMSNGLSADIQLKDQYGDNTAKIEEADLRRPIYVHPVMVMYQGDEISLFPPVDQEEELSSTYFLQDEQLASNPITRLLGACRSVLGESISAHEELVVDIEELSLHISEFALESSTITLKQIVDIYVDLQHHDGQENPPALYIQLSSRHTSLHRLEFLMAAVREKKGLSQIQPIYADEDSGSPEDASSNSHAENDSDPTYDFSNTKGPLLAHLHTVEQDDSQSDIAADTTLQAKSSATLGELGADDINSLTAPAVEPSLTHEVDTNGKSPPETKTGISSSPLNRTTEPGLEGRDESTVENEDFIDYEDNDNDDDEQTNEASSGSSTLQGDAFDSSNEGLHAVSKSGMVNSEIEESFENSYVGQDTELADPISGAVDDSRNAPNIDFEDTRSLDTSATDPSHLEHFQQRLEDSSTSRDLVGKDSAPDRFRDQLEAGNEPPPTPLNKEKDTATTQQNNGTASPASGAPSDPKNELGADTDPLEPVSSNDPDLPQDDQSSYTQDQRSKDGLSHRENHGEVSPDRGLTNPSFDANFSAESQVDSSNGQTTVNIAEPDTSLDAIDQVQEDEDEITYDDNDYEEEFPSDTSGVERVPDSTSGSLKRARNFHEQEESVENEVHGEEAPSSGYAKYQAKVLRIDAKRVRSD